MEQTIIPIAPELASKLRRLADTYETCSFIREDPCSFLYRYTAAADRETVACIAAMLAFGQRSQILCKIHCILDCADSCGISPAAWIQTGQYKESFEKSDSKFYRFYSYTDMRIFFGELKDILDASGTLGNHFKQLYEKAVTGKTGAGPFLLQQLISSAFPKSDLVPKNRTSACKRIHMFLRWMVRTDSPVDTGLWTWYSPADLIIPLDTHVLAEASRLGLFGPEAVKKPVTAGTAKNALYLTTVLKQIWPDDPCRGDFALFGLGVDKKTL